MNRGAPLCRDFQRGNCRYGARCKFSHQQPPQEVQEGRDGNRFAGLRADAARRPPAQAAPAAKDHRCGNARVCLEQIADDFANERPSWQATAFGHWKHLPNDAGRDASPEELRWQAYSNAQRGISLAQTAQAERALFSETAAEFVALLRGPYRGPGAGAPSAPTFGSQAFGAGPLGSPFQAGSALPPLLPTPQPAGAVFGAAQPPFGPAASPAPAMLFGKPVTPIQPPVGFGSAAPPQGLTFGSGVTPSQMGQQPPPTFSFGVASASPAAGPAAAFGAASPPPFGSAAQASALPWGSGSGLMGSGTPLSGRVGGFGMPSLSWDGAPPAPALPRGDLFSQPQPQSTPAVAAEAFRGMAPTSAPAPLAGGDAKWQTDTWQIGQIPEDEPPLEARH